MSLYCPKCGTILYGGNGRQYSIRDGDNEVCPGCGLSMNINWWFDLDWDINRDEIMRCHNEIRNLRLRNIIIDDATAVSSQPIIKNKEMVLL